MRLPDLSRLPHEPAPTRGLMTFADLRRKEEEEKERRVAATTGGNPSPPSDDEDDDGEERSPAGGSALRRLYVGLHAGGSHDAEGFLLMAEMVAARALRNVPLASWSKAITDAHGNSETFGEAVKKTLEVWFRRDAGVQHYDEYVGRWCVAQTPQSGPCDKGKAERYALTFKIMFALQPILVDAPAVISAVKSAMGVLVASYQQAVSSGVFPAAWVSEFGDELAAASKPPPDHQTPIRALFDGSGFADDPAAGIQKMAFLWCLQWMVRKATTHLWQEDLARAPSESAIAQRWAGSGTAMHTPAEKVARWVKTHVEVTVLNMGEADDANEYLTAAEMLDKGVNAKCAPKLALGIPCDLLAEQQRYLKTTIVLALEGILQGGDALVPLLTSGVALLIDEYERAVRRAAGGSATAAMSAFKSLYTAAYAQSLRGGSNGDAAPPATTEYLESDAEDAEQAAAPAAAPALLPDPPPNPDDARVVRNAKAPVLGEPWLGFRDTFVVRSDPRMAAGFALFCYKKSWDKPLAYAYRGVPVAQYLKALGPLKDDQKEARVPGLLAFLPLRMLRKLAAEYVRGPAQEISQVLPAHRADDYSIRASVKKSPELQAWAQSAAVQPRLAKLLEALPPEGLTMRPATRGDKCNLRMELDASKWGADADEAAALIRELRTRSHAARYNVTTKGHVYPLYNCAWSVLQNSQSETCYTGRASAQLLMSACIERMLAALDPLMARVGQSGDKTWRGVQQGRYGWVEAAGDDDEEWAARLIETLKATYFSVSTEESVARGGYFLGSGGILIEFQGACRGVRTVDALKGPWECYGHEQEILVAPHQGFTVLKPRLKNQTVGGARNITTITLGIAPAHLGRRQRGSRWVDDGADPHWSRDGASD